MAKLAGRILARAATSPLAVVAAAGLISFVVPTSAASVAGRGSPGGEPVSGERLYLRDCASCHGPRGEGTPRGTPLTETGAAGADFMLVTGRMPLATDEFRPRPEYRREERAALVDHVASLGNGPGVPELRPAAADLGRGGVLYRTHCAPCHGTTGAGSALAFGAITPPIARVAAIQVAEAPIVGPGAMPKLSPTVLSEDDLNDVVAYVRAMGREQATPPREVGAGRLGEAFVGLGAGLAGLVLLAGSLARRR